MSIAELNAAYNGPTDGPHDDRLPPQDLNAEQSVLGSMLLNKDAIADCLEAVKSHDFYRPAHELIFDAVLDLFGRGEPADAITVADELGKLDEVDYIVITAGSYDLLVEVVAESDEALLNLVSSKIRAIEGVVSTETFMYLHLHKQTYAWGVR